MRSTVLSLLLTLPSLVAASPEDIRFGVQGTLSVPSANLRDLTSSSGFGAAATMDWQFMPGRVLRSRLDYIQYREKSGSETGSFLGTTYTASWSYNVNSAALGLEYVHYFSGKPEGWNAFAGIQEGRYEIKGKYSTQSSGPLSDLDMEGNHRDKTKTKLGYALGLGYDFNRSWGTLLRFTSTDIDEARVNAYNLGVTYRF